MMKKNKFLAILATCLVPTLLIGCAKEPDNKYSTKHDSKYDITYLLTNFESENHWNAEGIAREDAPRGYVYVYDDPKSELDYIEPHAKESNACRIALDPSDSIEDSDLILKGDTDKIMNPPPPKCSVMSGFECNEGVTAEDFYPDANIELPTGDCKNVAFHITGVTAGEGLGFGTYFSDYTKSSLYQTRSDELLRNENGDLPPTFADEGRTVRSRDDEGNLYLENICEDNDDFAGKIHHCYYDTDPAGDNACMASGNECDYMGPVDDTDCCCVSRKPFIGGYETNIEGKYAVYGSVYTRGAIYQDTDGIEHFEFDDQTKTARFPDETKLKEPRCLAEKGQEGLVFWATGNATIEAMLNVPETSPISDGGLCDEEGGEKCYDYHKVRFELDGAWREYHASWDEFVQSGWGGAVPLNPNEIINIQFKVVAPVDPEGTKKFDAWFDHIGFYGGEKWDFVDALMDTEIYVEDTETTDTDTGVATSGDSDTTVSTDDTDADTGADASTDADTGTE